MNNKNKDFFSNNYWLFYRFSEEEILKQKKDIILYIVFNLIDNTKESLMTGVEDIKFLTGYDVGVEAVLESRKHFFGECELKGQESFQKKKV